MLKLRVDEIHCKSDLKEVIKEFTALIKKEKKISPNISCLRKDKKIVFADISVAVTQIEGRQCSIGFFRDISERKKSEQEKNQLQQKLEQYAKMLEKKVKKLEKNKIQLTNKEKLVFYGICEFPTLNDRELSKILNLNRSTLTAIRNRLKTRNLFEQVYIPNLKLINCNLLVLFQGNLINNKEQVKIKRFLQSLDFCSLISSTDSFIGFFAAKDMNSAHEKITSIMNKESDFTIFKDHPKIAYFPQDNSTPFISYSKIIKNLFNINLKKHKIKLKKTNKINLSKNLKEIFYALIKYPEASTSELAKKLRLTRVTITTSKNILLNNNCITKIIKPNLKKLNCELITATHIKFRPGKGDKLINDLHNSTHNLISLKTINKDSTLRIFKNRIEYQKFFEELNIQYNKSNILIKPPEIIEIPIQDIKINSLDFSNIVKQSWDLTENL